METAAAALTKPQIIVHIEKSLNYTVFDAKWIPCSAKFVVVGSHPRDTGARISKGCGRTLPHKNIEGVRHIGGAKHKGRFAPKPFYTR